MQQPPSPPPAIVSNAFHAYAQTLEATFATADDAQAASLAFRDLPPGMEMSVSSRWDDSNPRHLPNARAVTAAGAKATYYLNGVDPAFVEKTVRPILALGCSIGAHTKTHPYLSQLNANGIFDEILGNRVAVESATDACVSGFTLPFCDYRSRANPDACHAIGESLRRAGILGGGDVLENPAATYGLPADSLAGCLHFGFDDRNPSRALFEERIGGAEERFRSGDIPVCGPHVAMGTHSWASDDGMAEITRSFETRTRNPAAPYADRTWFCNENEFIAAWMQARHARIVETAVSGATVRWTILRPEPADLGADVPLFIQFGRAPVATSVDGAPLAVTESAQAAIPHGAGHALPARIEHLPCPANGDAPAASAKFPGLAARLDVDSAAGRATLRVRNSSETPLHRLRIALRVPLAFESVPSDGEERAIAPGDSATFEFPLTRAQDDAWHNDGPALFDAQLDFELGGQHGRIHATWVATAACTPVPGSLRDSLRIAPALPSVLWTPERLARLSRPDASLDELRLFPMGGIDGYAPCAFQLKPTAPEARALVDAVEPSARTERLYVAIVEFEATGREATLETRGYGTLYLNGEQREFKNGVRVPTLPGRNRVVLATPLAHWCLRGILAVFEDGSPQPATFRCVPLR